MPALVNRLEHGHDDEPGDCAMVALAVYTGTPYTDVLRAVSALDRQQGTMRDEMKMTVYQCRQCDFRAFGMPVSAHELHNSGHIMEPETPVKKNDNSTTWA